MRNRLRRWIPGHRRGLARSVAVYGIPGPDPAQLDELLGRCARLRTRARGFELDGNPDDLELLDHAIDDLIAEGDWHSPTPRWNPKPVFSLAQ